MLEQSGAVATAQFMEQVAPLVQVNPEIFDKLDTDQMVDELAQRMGVPASIIRSDEQVAAIRRQRAEAQAAQQAQAVAMMQAEAAAKLGGVSTQGTVAGELLGADGEASS